MKEAKSCRDDFDATAFARRLRHVRITLGLTEEEAAAVAGRTVETWRHYENIGKGRITEALLRFAAKFDVSLDWLLTGDGPPPRRAGLRLVHSVGKPVAVLPFKAESSGAAWATVRPPYRKTSTIRANCPS